MIYCVQKGDDPLYIYRPHRGSLDEAMQQAQEFETLEALLEHIVKENTIFDGVPAFEKGDIVIGSETINDYRIGWQDTRHVCVKKYYNEKYIIPQCIGWIATKYK